MDAIYHEKQDGLLCAQHCLNNLLQDSYYTAVDLATIGRELDNMETTCMAAAGFDTPEFQQFINKPSENMDDSGMFSVQVLQKALEQFSLSLVNIESDEECSREAKSHPERFLAFICNFEAHWLAVRKFGHQWFNLNSMLSAPELISDLHLSMYLTQLSMEGYTIFLVLGTLPDCEANQILSLMRITQASKPSLLPEYSQSSDAPPSNEDEDNELQTAIALSLTATIAESQSTETTTQPQTAEFIQEQRLKRFE